MQTYVLRRLLLMIPVLWGTTLIVFFAVRIAPGDVILAQMQGAWQGEAYMARARAELGLDVPAPVQYVRWLGNVVRGNLGKSLLDGRPVSDMIARAFPVSAELAFLSTAVAAAIGIAIGVISAVRQDTALDYMGRFVSVLGLSIPNFVIASAVVAIPAYFWHYAADPVYHYPWQNLQGNLQQMLPAAIALGAHLSASSMRMTRSTVLEVMREDYVRTAWSKGLRERTIVLRHILKNALIPVVTILGGLLGTLLGGTVIVETIFNFPGLGKVIFTAIANRDYTVIQGGILVLATIYVTMNLLVDLSYGLFDPRIRYQ